MESLPQSKVDEAIHLISNSLLFDIAVTYKIPLTYLRNEELSRYSETKFFESELITGKINTMILKHYNEELLNYFNTAMKISYAPFSYLCFYQILEYHLDKSAFLSAKEKIINLINQPDFHSRQDHYVAEAVNFIKNENSSINHDKAKLDRVIDQFIDIDKTKEEITKISLLDYFGKDLEVDCKKILKLNAIDFEKHGQLNNLS